MNYIGKFRFVKASLKYIALTLSLLAIFSACKEKEIHAFQDQVSQKNYTYLSDITYDKDRSFAASSHSIHMDENDSNQMITLKVNDKNKSYIKGICAWANSQIIYDLRDYDYDYFTSSIGVDISEQSNYFNTGVRFYIYTSDDGENWAEKYKSDDLYGWSEAKQIKVEIKGAKYLKLIADDNSDNWWANWYDEAVFADAKLVKEDYTEDTSDIEEIKTIESYDKKIKENQDEEIKGDYELTLLQRQFVKNVGYDTLQALARYQEEYKETIHWLMNDRETLRLYLAGGKPEGSYLNSIKVLTRLYTTYQSDLSNDQTTKYGTKYSDIYRKMMLSLSLTASGKNYFFFDGTQISDPVTRYKIYKDLHLHKNSENELIENQTFEALTVEEMRFVMNTIIDDEEIIWLNDFVRNDKNGATSPYSYIRYTSGYDYTKDQYYSEDNYDQWNKKYHLSQYNITYKKGNPKLWILFEEGAVCGGLSKTGSCIWGTYKGLPNTCISQPAHCAYIYYTKDSDGNGIWNLGNNVSGWGKSGKTEHLNNRMMNDWGSGSYTSGWNANYILLAQAAQNEYSDYEKAEEILMLADVYKDDNEKLEEIYKKAIKTEKLNFDAWLGLIHLYEKDDTKTEQEYYDLAKEIAQTYTYYPNPMYDLLNLIKPHLTSTTYSTSFTLLQTQTLKDAASATNKESIQASAVREVANQLLGNIDTTIASFSFDGENAGKIILSDRYKDTDVTWDYSLDGGKTWTQCEEHSVALTKQELAEITSEHDIKVHIVGADYSDENVFTIDIKDSKGMPSGLYANDQENKLIGATKGLEWKYKEGDSFTSFDKKEPDLEGEKTLIVRAAATGIYLADTKQNSYKFTKDDTDETQKYISIKHLSIEEVSSEQTANGDHAKNAIDGNINTMWHTAYNGSDQEKMIMIKLDEPVYLSALQYVPRQTESNGRAKAAVLYVSDDKENWIEAANVTGWANNADAKIIKLENSIKTKYVKFVVTNNWGDGRSFASAAMINLYEDQTKTKQGGQSTTETPTTETPTTEVPTTETPTTEAPTTQLSKTEKTEVTTRKTVGNTKKVYVKIPGRSAIKTIKSGKKKATLKWGKISDAKGYMIQYSTSKKFSKKCTKTKYTTKTRITLKKLKSKKKYYFRIKAYTTDKANKKIYAKNWSKVKKKKIK